MEVIFEERSSKGISHDYYTKMSDISKDYKEPPYVYNTLMEMVEADPVLFNAISLTVDLVTKNGFDFIGEKTEIEKAKKLFNETLDFDMVIKNILWSFIIYGDSYMELKWDESHSEIMELNPRDTMDMKIDFDEHGEIKGYVETIPGKGPTESIKYATDEIVYFRQYWIGSQIYSRCPFKSVTRDYSTCVYARDYLMGIFKNLPPKIVYFLKNASKAQREDFYENLIRAKENPQMDIIAQGEAFDTKIQQTKFDDGLLGVLGWLQRRILMITRVPPHWVGDISGANRGIGENVVIPYECKIKDLQHRIASQVNRELMPLLKLKCEFKYNAISLLDEKSILENMEKMSTMGFDSETIIEYARDHGLNLKADAEIEKEESTGQMQYDNAPSRQRSNPKGTMANKLDVKGISAAGTKKLESKKMAAT